MNAVVPLFAARSYRSDRRSQARLHLPVLATSAPDGGAPSEERIKAKVAPVRAAGEAEGAAVLTTPLGEGIPADQAVVLELLGTPPIAFQRAYVDLTGSVAAALWLSNAIERISPQITGPGAYALEMTAAECQALTGLSRREQDSARSRLREAGLVTEERSGRSVRYQIQLEVIAARLMRLAEARWNARPQPTGAEAATGAHAA